MEKAKPNDQLLYMNLESKYGKKSKQIRHDNHLFILNTML